MTKNRWSVGMTSRLGWLTTVDIANEENQMCSGQTDLLFITFVFKLKRNLLFLFDGLRDWVGF